VQFLFIFTSEMTIAAAAEAEAEAEFVVGRFRVVDFCSIGHEERGAKQNSSSE
jgi:hypothetical protein